MHLHAKISFFLENKKTRLMALAVLVVLYGILLTHNITTPFWGLLEDDSAFAGTAAKNWIAYSPAALDFGWKYSQGSGYYLHHPQFVITPLYASYVLFGIGEWQTRLVPMIFSLLSLVLFWFLLEYAFKDRFLTFAASFFFALLPSSVFFGRMMSYEPITRFFIILSFLLLLLIENKKEKKYVWGFLASVVVGGLTDWPYFLAAFAAWLYVIFRKDIYCRRILFWTLPLAVIFSFSITAVQIAVLGGAAAFFNLNNLFIDRSLQHYPSFFKMLIFRGENEIRMFTGIGLVLAFAGALRLFNLKKNENWLPAAMIAFPGITYMLLFGGWSLAHPYWSFYLTPFIALAAAYAIQNAKQTVFVILAAAFVLESGWYVRSLFLTRSFEMDDFYLMKEVNRTVPGRELICAGTNEPSRAEVFVFDHKFQNGLCPDSNYAFIRKAAPSLEYVKQLSYGFEKPFSSNLKKTSFEAAAAIEAIKLIPGLKDRIAHLINDSNAVYGEMLEIAANDERVKQSRGFKEIKCSTNFCLYSREGTK